MERLVKYLANRGVASRRKCDEIIAQGRVTVNGQVIDNPAHRVDAQVDEVAVDGVVVRALSGHTYIALNKPKGYVTTVKDTHGRPTVMDLVRSTGRRLYPVGRLDMDSEGLVILTDDGDLAFRITHPSSKVRKTYIVKAKQPVTRHQVDRLRMGVELEDGTTQPARVHMLDPESNLLEVEITEGRNRQIRRMFEALSNPVQRLIRVRIGNVALGDLRLGGYRSLSAGEVGELKRLTQKGAESKAGRGPHEDRPRGGHTRIARPSSTKERKRT